MIHVKDRLRSLVTRRQRYSTTLLILVLLGVAPQNTIAQSNTDSPDRIPTVTLDAVLRAWKARQDHVRSAHIVWTERRFQPKGALLSPDVGPEVNPDNVVVPAQDDWFDVPSELKFDGARMFYTVRDRGWWKGKYYPRHYITTFDGETSVIYWPLSEREYPNASIQSEKRNSDVYVAYLLPFIRTFRVLEPRMGGHAVDQLRLRKGDPVSIEGQMCHIVEAFNSQRKSITTYYVNAAHDFSIVRMTDGNERSVWLQMDVVHKNDSTHGLVPTKWRTTVYGPTAIKETIVGSVMACTINPYIPLEDFQVRFPIGTWVTDTRDRTDYLVRPNNGKRIIQPREMGTAYNRLLNSDTGDAH